LSPPVIKLFVGFGATTGGGLSDGELVFLYRDVIEYVGMEGAALNRRGVHDAVTRDDEAA
jgi:hypothetical protein